MLLGGGHMLISKLRTHLLAITRDHCARLSSTCKSLRVCTSAASNHPHPYKHKFFFSPRSWEQWQLYCQFPFGTLVTHSYSMLLLSSGPSCANIIKHLHLLVVCSRLGSVASIFVQCLVKHQAATILLELESASSAGWMT